MTGLFGRPRTEIAVGAVHVPGWLSVAEQRDLVAACRQWARPPAGLRHTKMPSGGTMSVQTVCLGWHWLPYRYSRTAEDVDGAPVKPLPRWLADLGRRALAAAQGGETVPAVDRPETSRPETSRPETSRPETSRHVTGRPDADQHAAGPVTYQPDVALINFYDEHAKMGLHVDKDERSPAPVVSLSLGDSCVFRFGHAQSRGRPWHDLTLESGDLFVFGGPARFAYHGVLRTLPGTGRADIGLPSGRLNITLRESGLAGLARLASPPGPASPD